MRILLMSSEEGDWKGLYIDGVLFCENHSLDLRCILDEFRLRNQPITWVGSVTIDFETIGWARCPHQYNY
jgi:hypothetical protein